jgi:hypothetical protein
MRAPDPYPVACSTLAANSRGIKRFLTPTKKTRLVAWCATPCGKTRFFAASCRKHIKPV